MGTDFDEGDLDREGSREAVEAFETDVSGLVEDCARDDPEPLTEREGGVV